MTLLVRWLFRRYCKEYEKWSSGECIEAPSVRPKLLVVSQWVISKEILHKTRNYMEFGNTAMGQKKKIGLLAHDNKLRDLLEWAKFNKDLLAHHELYATRRTGERLEELDLQVIKLQSGQLGGDQQIGAKVVEGNIDFLIFFWDPLEPLPHDPDVKALLRIAVLWNIPIACNRASADFIISSPLMSKEYERLLRNDEVEREQIRVERVTKQSVARIGRL